LRVSELGFGAVEIGVEYGIQVDGKLNRPEEGRAMQIVQRALDLGINLIDTARGYGDSERIIGQAVAGKRDSVVLMTKLAAIDGDLTGEGLQRFMVESLETSLRLLRTEAIDVYQVHSATTTLLQRGEVMGILDRFRRDGKVRFVGATVYGEDDALAVLDDPRMDVLQIAYTMLDASMEDRVIPLAAARGVGVIARSVLHRGVLTPKGTGGSADERRLHEAANGFDWLFDDDTQSLPHAAMRFALSHPGVGCALLGMDSIEQVEQNLGYGDIRPFTSEQLRRVRDSAPPDPWAILPAAAKDRSALNK
jgi:aryl-alcohol dehydrogenase-like predicted oxidoreductase